MTLEKRQSIKTEIEQRIAQTKKTIERLRKKIKPISQHKEIKALNKSLTLLKEKAESGTLVKDVKDEEPLPHY